VGSDCCARCRWVLEGFDTWELWIGRYADLGRESVIFAEYVDGKMAWMKATDTNGQAMSDVND